MFRKHNRNLKQKFWDGNFHDDHLPKNCFGEYVLPCIDSSDTKEKSTFYQDSDTVDNLSLSKSSSSSLSWGEDCEIEATQKVTYEYEKMNNVLCGLETIPPYYDKAEYKLWIKTFPHLRSTISSLKQNEQNFSQSITEKCKTKCDNTSTNVSENAVIDDLLNKMCYKLSNSADECKVLDRRKNNKQMFSESHGRKLCDENLADNFSSFLRISPAPTYAKPMNVDNRRRYTNYMKPNLLVSHSKDYTSLPHLSHLSHLSHLPQLPDSFINMRSNNQDNLKRKKKKLQQVNKIVLPPIDIPFNQFRSISAIPLQQSKCSSALSTKTNLNFALGFSNPNVVCNSSVNKKRFNGFY